MDPRLTGHPKKAAGDLRTTTRGGGGGGIVVTALNVLSEALHCGHGAGPLKSTAPR